MEALIGDKYPGVVRPSKVCYFISIHPIPHVLDLMCISIRGLASEELDKLAQLERVLIYPGRS